LKQFAVYYPGGSSQAKRHLKRNSHFKRHHRHHRRERSDYSDLEKPTEFRKGSAAALQRTAYYDAESQVAQGLVFMNHMGGQGSGVFDQ
jgi:hypothetical protein